MNKLFKEMISSDSTTSSKRVVTLLISLHFILASFSILFIAFYVIFYLPKGKVEPELLALLKEVLEYDFYIILSGLGFITVENMGQVMIEKIKAKWPHYNQSNYNQDYNTNTEPSIKDEPRQE